MPMKRTAIELTSNNTKKKFTSLQQQFQRSLVLSQTGSILLSEGKFLEALEDLNESLALNPLNVFTLTNRALVFKIMKKLPEALLDLDAALDLNPQNAYALTLRGDVLRLLKSPLHALDDLDAALTINPQNPYALICRGMALRQLSQFKQAMEDIDKALSIIPAPSTTSSVSNSQMSFFKGKVFKPLNPSTPTQEPNENPLDQFGK
jgi:tetratricopeptide (TPR) repeat protein